MSVSHHLRVIALYGARLTRRICQKTQPLVPPKILEPRRRHLLTPRISRAIRSTVPAATHPSKIFEQCAADNPPVDIFKENVTCR
jgi:hypothetical protein